MMEEISPIDVRIVEYLSLNPRKNSQLIKRALGEPYRHYPIVRALSQMSKKGWVTYTEGRAEKKVIVKFYSLSSLGIGIALENDSESELLKTLEFYQDSIPLFQTLSKLVRMLKPCTAVKLLRVTGGNILRNEPKAVRPDTLTLSVIGGLADFSKSELEDLVGVANYFRKKAQRKAKLLELTK
jgi:hypothetical protein